MSIVEFPIADRPITESEVDKLHSKAFRDLEGGICDCATMARIAAQIVTNEAGLDGELVFAVAHVSEMLTALKANYYAAWYDEKQQVVRHEAPAAPIDQKAQPAAAGRSCKTAEAVAGKRGRGLRSAPHQTGDE